jgi:hypothetical protein
MRSFKRGWGERWTATNVTLVVFDLAISRDYILTDGHDILKVFEH